MRKPSAPVVLMTEVPVIKAQGPQPSQAVRRMKEYHPPLGDRRGLRLDFNENTFACSPRVLEALGRISRGDLTRYPEREPVEHRVAAHLGLKPQQVLLTNGVDEAIHLLCQTYLEAGAEILLPVPTYSMYEVYASGTPASIIQVPAEEAFRFPLHALLNAITPATRLIAIANPNSPTGQAARREDLLRIIEAAPHAAVLVDEAYFHFYGETVVDLVGHAPACASAFSPLPKTKCSGSAAPSPPTASTPSPSPALPPHSTTKNTFAGTSAKS